MKTINLEFDGRVYVCRVVNSNECDELVIAPTYLLDALHLHSFGEENDGFANEEAVMIDEEVFSTPMTLISHYPMMNWSRN